MNLRVTSIRKTNYRPLAIAGVPAKELTETKAVKTIGPERKLGQYKFIDGNKVRYFRNFDELKFFSNRCLFGRHKYVILERGTND